MTRVRYSELASIAEQQDKQVADLLIVDDLSDSPYPEIEVHVFTKNNGLPDIRQFQGKSKDGGYTFHHEGDLFIAIQVIMNTLLGSTANTVQAASHIDTIFAISCKDVEFDL